MIWLAIGLMLTVAHILLLKNSMCIRAYLTKNSYSRGWTGDAKIAVQYWLALLIFLFCIIPYLGIVGSIMFWIGVFISSLVNTKSRRPDGDLWVLIFQMPTVTDFLTKEI